MASITGPEPSSSAEMIASIASRPPPTAAMQFMKKYRGNMARINKPAFSSGSTCKTVGAIAAEKKTIAPRDAKAIAAASSGMLFSKTMLGAT